MRPARCVLAILLALNLPGCARVQPWQRGTTMKRTMQPPPDPLEVAMDAHMHENREAMAGARYGRGASCGCN